MEPRFRFTDRSGQTRAATTVEELAAALADGSLDGAAMVEDLERGTTHPAAELAGVAEEPPPRAGFNWPAALIPCWLAWRGMWIRQIGSFMVFLFFWGLLAAFLTVNTLSALLLAYALIGLVHGAAGDTLLHARARQARRRAQSRGLSAEETQAAVGKALASSPVSVVVWGAMGAFVMYWLVLPTSHGHDHGKAYVAAMKSDLRNLVTAEESYFADYVTYTSTITNLLYSTSSGVTVTLVQATGLGWSATSIHNSSDQMCGIFVGNAEPPVARSNEGEPKCEPHRH